MVDSPSRPMCEAESAAVLAFWQGVASLEVQRQILQRIYGIQAVVRQSFPGAPIKGELNKVYPEPTEEKTP